MRFLPPLLKRFADEALDSVLRNVQQRIDQLQGVAIVRGKLVTGIELPDQTNIPVRHGFGRPARAFVSVPYAISGLVTTGGILRDRTRLVSEQFDSSQYVVLYAAGWGTTMYVDAWIVA
jgi:hypothetical protein